MTDFSFLSERLRYALKKEGKTQNELATAIGVKQPTVAGWLSGRTKNLRSDYGLEIAKFLKINQDWLVTGRGAPEARSILVIDDESPAPSDDYVQIKEYSIRAGAGNGTAPTYDEIADSHPSTYKRSYFQKLGINPDYCMKFEVVGDSMEPTLYEGDRILVNTKDNLEINNGHVYAINVNDQVKVKRLARKINGDLIIKSDNKEYQDEILPADQEFTYFSIIGRVIEKSGGGGL